MATEKMFRSVQDVSQGHATQSIAILNNFDFLLLATAFEIDRCSLNNSRARRARGMATANDTHSQATREMILSLPPKAPK